MRINGAAGVAVAVLAATAVAVAAATGPEPREPASGHAVESQRAISITGDVTGMYPGGTRRVRLRLRNRSPRALTVTSVSAKTFDAGPSCPGKNLRATRKRVRVRVPARSQRRLGYRIGMVRRAAEACQGSQFPIRYRARVR